MLPSSTIGANILFFLDVIFILSILCWDDDRRIGTAAVLQTELNYTFHFIVCCWQETFELICNCNPECTELPAVFPHQLHARKFWACFQRHIICCNNGKNFILKTSLKLVPSREMKGKAKWKGKLDWGCLSLIYLKGNRVLHTDNRFLFPFLWLSGMSRK